MKEQIKRLCKMIGDAIGESIDRDNPEELTGKLMELSALQSNATYAYALAEQEYNAKIAELAQKDEYKRLTATDKKMIFAGLAKEEIYLLTTCERHIKNLSYSIEALRSALSWKKTELEQSRYQTT